MDHLLSRERKVVLSCLVLNVHDIQEDIENWIVVKKNCENDKEEIRH